ncbi:hypothetical protein HPB52_009122 [Rhipicephalus sanguineus]|uniref:Mutator-like transposase domain-containing protein n=1 Tax=Rhipicephalus sanguineus TaxID=34632 RepID=A0A9D4YN95_RHISA|nr:hypothetical protein HPB52_009122 [Rhipicephalus sanguineus]
MRTSRVLNIAARSAWPPLDGGALHAPPPPISGKRAKPRTDSERRRRPDAPTSDRPNTDTEPRNSGCEIAATVEFVSASQRKIGFFESERRPVDAATANTLLCEIDALTALAAGAQCPTCHERKLGVREAAGKRKGLSAFIELCCQNSDCPESALSVTHTSRRTTSAGDQGTSARFDSGSSRDSFAVNVKAVMAARAIGAGHDHLSRFCAILGLPSPMHHKTFNGISKKLHGAAMTANAAESLNSKIWLLCPKTKFASRTTVETATALRVLWYNKGHRGFEKVPEGIGILPSQDLATHGDHCDVMRIRKMNLKQTAEARAHRRNTAKRARVKDTDRKSREGPSYGAGDF